MTKMTNFLENMLARIWNGLAASEKGPYEGPGLEIGRIVVDGRETENRLLLPHGARPEHIAVLGRTGTGKSSLLKFLAAQDIRGRRGFAYFDLHGDATAELLEVAADEERSRGVDLSERVIVIEPADVEFSIGLNVLDRTGASSFVAIAEFTAILKRRWGLDNFGARTEELLRNALMVLAENGLTLVELSALLTNSDFRCGCLLRVSNDEVRHYFEQRYDVLSDPQQAAYRDAILNKLSEFTADPKFRHLVGQQRSTVSFLEAIDRGCWIIVRLDKGRLGEQALTLGALCLAQLKFAIFARRTRKLFSIYCDEVQNLLAFDSGLENLLSEARKFAVSLLTANQYLDQYPPAMRSAIFSVNTQIFFRLAAADAERVSVALDGGKGLTELLKNLPQRNLVFKSGHSSPLQAVVPQLKRLQSDFSDLYARSRARWARRRVEIEAEIRSRVSQSAAPMSAKEGFDDWE